MSIIILKDDDKFPNSLEGISEIHFEEGTFNVGEIKPSKSLTLIGKSKKTIIKGSFDTSVLGSLDYLTVLNATILSKKKEYFLKATGPSEVYMNNIKTGYY